VLFEQYEEGFSNFKKKKSQKENQLFFCYFL